MDNCNLTAYGLYSPEQCKNVVQDFEDYYKKFQERQQELLSELERQGFIKF